MKKLIYIITLLVTFASCKEKAETLNTDNKDGKDSIISNDNEEALLMLNEFYSLFYFDDSVTIDQTKRKSYISERLLTKIDSLSSDGENLILDYDPFIKGQDYNGESIKNTLEIIPLKKKNEFRVSFILFGSTNEERTTIDYAVVKNRKGQFIIASIINDQYLNITDSQEGSISDKKISHKESIDFSGSWKLDCDSELLTFDVSNDTVYLFLNSNNSIYINALLKKVKDQENKYTLHFLNTEFQNEFDDEIGTIKEDEIAKDKSIATVTFTANTAMSLNWIGLYNVKNNKIQFAKEFVFLKENKDTNPIVLQKCE